VIKVAITTTAFEAIASTLPLGSVGYEAELNAKGERLVWLAPAVVDRLTAMREPGESYCDVIPEGSSMSTCGQAPKRLPFRAC
jgi:hypothetical protein